MGVGFKKGLVCTFGGLAFSKLRPLLRFHFAFRRREIFRDAMLDSCAYDLLVLLAISREPKSFSMDFVAVACGVGLDVRASLGQASSWRWRA